MSENETTSQNSGAPTVARPDTEADAKAADMADPQSAEFSRLEENRRSDVKGVEADAIQHIPVTLSVEVGRSEISIQDLLQLNQGSVLQLDRAAGEPMDIRVNGCLMAHGEVVVINDQFGVRLTSIVSPRERANQYS